MKKKDKKKKVKKGKLAQEDSYIPTKNSQIETLSKIVELSDLAKGSLMKGVFDDAIYYSEQVIRLAIENGMDNHIKKQEEFMKIVAEKVQKDFYISEINEAASKIERIYDILIKAENFNQAHEVLEAFKIHYKDKINLDSIKIIQELIKKDLKERIKFKIGLQNDDRN
jgi:hypothetical protein